ncbi:glycosyltransferase family 4 protein [Vibrio parahaemolyticus]|nr:glycosyltransferase family 4 protein [Vibrio parahaemolyticus]
MKIALVSGSNVIHTIRWANALVENGHEVHLVDCHNSASGLSPLVIQHKMKFAPPLGYFLNVPSLVKLLKNIAPDVVNVHYASGYGTLARLAKVGKSFPYVLSLWGSDIYDFPSSSFIHKMLVRGNMLSATSIASTSYCMAEQARKVLGDASYFCEITPFGVESEKFAFKKRILSTDRPIVIGTVKRLMNKYGIDTLIESFYLLTKKDPSKDYRLILVGEGPQESHLKELVSSYGLAHCVEFRGACLHSDVPSVLDEFDVFAALSRLDSESFGVAIVEAAFAGVPVVVTEADGPKEVVTTMRNGFVVRKENPEEACNMLYELINNHELYSQFSLSGRQLGIANYEWVKSVSIMESVYERTIKRFKSGGI